MSGIELYGAQGCPYTAELREELAWKGVAFTEYDVDTDVAARERLCALTGGLAAVPVLVENGRIARIGWQGRTCVVASGR